LDLFQKLHPTISDIIIMADTGERFPTIEAQMDKTEKRRLARKRKKMKVRLSPPLLSSGFANKDLISTLILTYSYFCCSYPQKVRRVIQ